MLTSRSRLVRAAPWLLPVAILAVSWWMRSRDVRFAEFSSASPWPALTQVMLSPWTAPAGCALALLLALGARVGSGPRVRRVLLCGSFATSAATLAAVAAGVAWPIERWSVRVWRIARGAAAAGSSHRWAGSYHLGDGTGFNFDLTLSPGGEFLQEWHGCMGHYESVFGTVSEREGRLVLHADASLPPRDETVLDVVPWGDRRYVVEPRTWGELCTGAFDGSEPRHESNGGVFLRRDDWRRDAPGMPLVPARVEACFRGQHAETPVTSVDERGIFRFVGGFVQGFHRGERISLRDPSGEIARGVLFKVDEDESWGEPEARSIPIGPGWIVMATSGRPPPR
jgi:hypothetical protein